ncbi:MAG: universal stress protein [Bacteroidales bacterium]|nr:universal stress protein [Bacteroidales bacterium]
MKDYYNSILVPTDFTEQSLVAMEQIYNLARLNNVPITLLYVIPENTSTFFIPFFSKVQTNLMTKQYEEECMAKLNGIIAKAAKKTKVTIKPLIDSGKIYEKIIEISEKIFAKYIVMGVNSNPPDSKKKSTLGSNTLRVLREAKCPVITIKGNEFRDGCRTIVLPLDLTKETKNKVAQAILLAKYYDASIKVFSCILTSDEEIVTHLTKQINQVRKTINENNVACSSELRSGIKGKDTLAGMILTYATEVEADLIMIMTQQENDWTEFFVGSTAQSIISQSKVPVMSLSPQNM